MDMTPKKYPIGVQDFKGLREDGFCYVDKTAQIYQLVHSGRNAFLSRPRRFGKSLLCTTLKYYSLAERDLFRGLAIERLEKEWVKRPVLHIDFNHAMIQNVADLEEALSTFMCQWEEVYGKVDYEAALPCRFAGILKRAHEQTGQRVAVLIDEYDKPLLETIGNPQAQDDIRRVLKAFYGQFKSADDHLQFLLITGVTKFSKVSVFSDLNNLKDISMDDDYATLCGITGQELDEYFGEDIAHLAQKFKLTPEAMRDRLREVYDGYHFSAAMQDVYNPFSLLGAFSSRRIDHYWFSTGTPTFLIRLLKAANYNLQSLSGVQATASRLSDISEPEHDPIPILFQSGYLTIKDYDPEFDTYTLDFPNREVRQGFFDALIPQYNLRHDVYGNDFCIVNFVMAVRDGDVFGFLDRLKALLANIPYTQAADQRAERIIEQQYQNVVYIIFTLMGFYTEVEHHTAMGRIDLVVKTPKYIYVIEFKVGKGTPQEALQQIHDRHYADPYLSDPRQLFRIGIGFSPDTHNMDEWVVEPA